MIKIRASQINGCAICLNMHTKEARELGETEQRIYALYAWRETPYFTLEERAVLALTEAVTLVAESHVPDDVYNEAARYFDEKRCPKSLCRLSSSTLGTGWLLRLGKCLNNNRLDRNWFHIWVGFSHRPSQSKS